MSQNRPPIPTNLITGFLGVGKTTAIGSLVRRRPQGERWSVFVNEYGEVSVDQVLLGDMAPGIEVQELGGGCFCCTTAMFFEPILDVFIQRTQPDRLLIEPSGAGHPARIIDLLRGPLWRDRIDLRATICLVDPQDFDENGITCREVLLDQIQMADVVVLNRVDERPPELVQRCREWVLELDPPKFVVAECHFGMLDLEWLDIVGTVRHRALLGEGPHSHAPALERTPARPEPGRPLRFENSGPDQSACGWIFSPDDRFDREQILELLDELGEIRRVKGVFHCGDDWWAVNRVRGDSTWGQTTYRRDSRLEVISEKAPSIGWDAIEVMLLGCLM